MATIKITQRTKPLANGKFPIYLRVSKDRDSKFISLNLSCEKSEWNEAKSELRKNHPNYKQINNALVEIKNRAESIITNSIARELDLSLEDFKNSFLNYKKGSKMTLFKFWELKIEDLIKSQQVGNARAYKDTKNSFYKFSQQNSNLNFKDITVEALQNYEVFLRANGGTDGGISIKMRTIRALYNDAIKKDYASQEHYPFNNYKISKLKKVNTKRALNVVDIEALRGIDPNKYPELVDSLNYFLFSYHTRGMNFYDMMMLKWSNIENSKIHYVRRKTKGSLSISIVEPVRKILDYYKNTSTTQYIFPILTSDNLTPMQIEYRKDKTLKKFNKDLKKIGGICGIDTKLTSYVARHSFATNLKQKGVSTDIISEAMGHKSIAITQVYLKELEDDVIDDAVNKLL